MIVLLNTYLYKQITEAPYYQAAINSNSVAWLCGWICGSKSLQRRTSWLCKQQQQQQPPDCKPIKKGNIHVCTMFLLSFGNTTGSMGEWKNMLWEHECYHKVFEFEFRSVSPCV